MRETKFRAWDVFKNKMLIWDDRTFDIYKSGSIEGDIKLGVLRPYEEKDLPFNFKLMQYTGLKDKNGAEIYEGDILKVGVLRYVGGSSMRNEPMVVKFKDGMFKTGQVSLISINRRSKIIGNIFENSELVNSTHQIVCTAQNIISLK